MVHAQMKLWSYTIIPKLQSTPSKSNLTFIKGIFFNHNYFYRDKLHGLEYPMGERIIVKVNGMSSARMDTSFIDSKK